MGVENIVLLFCQRRGVKFEDIFYNVHEKNASQTRFMIWHYLHCTKKVSASSLSRMFNRNRPSIFRGIRVLSDHMKYHKEIRAEYESIVKYLEDAETPSNNSDAHS